MDCTYLNGSESCQLILKASFVNFEQLLEMFQSPPAAPLSSPVDLIQGWSRFSPEGKWRLSLQPALLLAQPAATPDNV